jgi:DNA repair exonuclease SbcCD ATPase subunit
LFSKDINLSKAIQAELENKVGDLEKQLEKMKRDLNDALNEKNNQENRSNQLDDELQSKNNSLIATLLELEESKKNIESAYSELDQSKKTNASLSSANSCEKITQENETLAKQYAEATAQLNKANEDLKQSLAAAQVLKGESEALSAAAVTEKEGLLNRVSALEVELAAEKNKPAPAPVVDTEKENALNAEIAALKQSLADEKNKPAPATVVDTTKEEELTKRISALEAALEALEKDHGFLTDTGVFTTDFIESWIEYKLDNEVNPMRLRPHPYEFSLYYDC